MCFHVTIAIENMKCSLLHVMHCLETSIVINRFIIFLNIKHFSSIFKFSGINVFKIIVLHASKMQFVCVFNAIPPKKKLKNAFNEARIMIDIENVFITYVWIYILNKYWRVGGNFRTISSKWIRWSDCNIFRSIYLLCSISKFTNYCQNRWFIGGMIIRKL